MASFEPKAILASSSNSSTTTSSGIIGTTTLAQSSGSTLFPDFDPTESDDSELEEMEKILKHHFLSQRQLEKAPGLIL